MAEGEAVTREPAEDAGLAVGVADETMAARAMCAFAVPHPVRTGARPARCGSSLMDISRPYPYASESAAAPPSLSLEMASRKAWSSQPASSRRPWPPLRPAAATRCCRRVAVEEDSSAAGIAVAGRRESRRGTRSVVSEPLIAVRDLTRTYHVGEVDVRALRGVSLDVQPGEFIALTGPSGSGKSTFMHLLGCLDRPTSGSYRLNGRDVAKLSKRELAGVRNKEIGFVFQGFNLLTRTTALENVELPLLYAGGIKGSKRHALAKAALDSVGLGDRIHHHPNQMSGGQQQRVAIARALVTNPVLLLADEPTGNLDSRTSVEVMDIFQRLNIERGLTIVLVTHEHDIAEHGTRIVAFRDGRVRGDDPVETRRTAAEELEQLLAQADDLVDA